MFLRSSLFLLFFAQYSLQLHCLQPFVPENGHVIFNEPGPYAPGTMAKYSCALGFERIGVEERKCQENGSWALRAPVCAINVAANKPMQQSSGGSSSHVSRGLCTVTNERARSWWEVDLLGEYSVHIINVRLGKQSSVLISIEAILSDGHIKLCDISTASFDKNSTVSVPCRHERVSRIRLTTKNRLQLCALQVFATDAVSSWQCAQGSMDIVGVFGGICFAASREEQNDWLGAQRKCLDRGASLPLRISSSAQRGLATALSSTNNQKEYYWIGVSSSISEWRWADGATVAESAGWPTDTIPPPGIGEAVLLARPLDWKWLPATQAAWNPFICQSKPKFCTSPGVGEASRVVFSSHSYAIGTYCFYSCDEGYDLAGESQRECMENGRWSGDIPECIPLDCGDVEPWPSGTVRLLNGSSTLNNQMEYECSPGWEVVENRRRTCLSNGLWSGSSPECREIDCGKPPAIAHGDVFAESFTFQSSANYSCWQGFRLIGHEVVQCGEKGTWLPTSPVCYDLTALREMKGESGDGNAVLALVAVLLIAFLVFAVFKFSRPTSIAPTMDKIGGQVIYATPNVPNGADSVVYYASCAAMPMTQMEIPPHMLSLQQLPNGNIHVTMPIGRPLVRPQIPTFCPSPTPSQLLYSFDHEPIYDTPPDISGDTLAREENVYEKFPEAPPPPPPKCPPPSL